MRALLFTIAVLVASAAHAQNMWQINSMYQGQINAAQQSAALPYYYGYGYAPRYYGRGYSYPRYYGGSDFYRSGMLYEQQQQTRQLRRANLNLQAIQAELEWQQVPK